MTGNELIERVKLFGARVSEELEADFQNDQLFTAINVAINEINRLFPVTKTVRLLNYPCRPTVYHKMTVHKGGEDTVFDASDIKSLAFAVSGTGYAELVGGGHSVTFTWTDATQLEVKRSIVAHDLVGYEGGDIQLIFRGECNYMIKDLSMYSELESDMTEDVEPWSAMRCFDIASRKYAGGAFLDFAKLPVRGLDVRLNTPNDYRIEGSRVYIPAEKSGIYEVEYYARPTQIVGESADIELDIDFRLHELVALKAAYHLFAVLDPEAAAVCDAEYQKMLGVVLTTMPKVSTPGRFRDVRGW